MVVVDNNSTDDTAAIARTAGAAVVHEPVQGIARARNAGARHAQGDVLVFVDADALVSPALLEAIHDAMSDPSCIGGGVDVEYQPRRRSMRLYLSAWRLLGRRMRLVQGATQFCRRSVFEQVGGYAEQAWIGEDVDFYRSMERLPRSAGGGGRVIEAPPGARAAWFGSSSSHVCRRRRGASTSGRCGRRCSGQTHSSPRCSAAARRSGQAGTDARCGRAYRRCPHEASGSSSYGTTQVTAVPRPDWPEDTSSVPPICSASVSILVNPRPCSA